MKKLIVLIMLMSIFCSNAMSEETQRIDSYFSAVRIESKLTNGYYLIIRVSKSVNDIKLIYCATKPNGVAVSCTSID